MKKAIRIGHPSYQGINRSKWVNTKTEAVAELMTRGIKRAAARLIISDICSRQGGYATCQATKYGESIEVCDFSRVPGYC